MYLLTTTFEMTHDVLVEPQGDALVPFSANERFKLGDRVFDNPLTEPGQYEVAFELRLPYDLTTNGATYKVIKSNVLQLNIE